MARAKTRRDEELSTRPRIKKRLLEIFNDVEQGFADQRERADDILDYWDIYNCKLGPRQFYNGNSQIFVPIVQNAVRARKTRFVNQLFPRSGRNVEVITENDDIPHATTALMEYRVRQAKLRTRVMPALVVSGDVEGQYNLYCGWREITRRSVSRETIPLKVGGLDFPELGETDSIEEKEEEISGPYVEVLSDVDILVLPPTVDDVEEAIEIGGSVTVIRRWTKQMISDLAEDGEIEKSAAEYLKKTMSRKDSPGRPDQRKKQADAAGIKGVGNGKFALIYETWAKVKVDGEMRICRTYYGGDDIVLGCKLNPYWCDRVPVISAPVEKVTGVFKGRAPVSDVVDLQIFANDMINEAADTAHFSAMPIIMTDPEKNPKIGSMVLGLAAVWETSPKDTTFAQFPALWQHGFEIVSQAKNEIFQTLGVNPAMIPQQTGGRNKRNQAEIAMEQQVDLLTTSDAVTNIEEAILTPMIERFAFYDHQFRDDALLVRSFGDMGVRAKMEEVPPIQIGKRWEFRWFGVEAARNAQQIQQQIAMLNVVKGIPPALYQGFKLNAAPFITQLVENAFGPRLAPLVFEDMKRQLGMEPEFENQMLEQTFDLPVHAMDDDQAHLQAHMQLLQGGDPSGVIRVHIQRHQQQFQAKSQAAMQNAQQGLPGMPGGAGPGVAGTPRPGAQPAGPRMLKGPEGMISPERMPAAGAVTMPRRM